MTKRRVCALSILLVTASSTAARAQTAVPYAEFFDTLYAPATQAVAASGGPSTTAASYGGAALLSSLLASQMALLPTGSNAGGFTWTYDAALGTFSRAADSFGPHTNERAHTIGRNKVNFGYTYQRFTFDKFEGDAISVNSTGQVSTAPSLHMVENVALSRADVSVNTLFVNYGVTSTIDVGVLVPFLSSAFDGSMNYTVRSGGPNGPVVAQGTNTALSREDRIGDVVFRAKWNFTRRPWGGMALGWDAVFPSDNQLGAEGFKLYLVASRLSEAINVHMNGGFTVYSCNKEPAEICTDINGGFLRAGVDKAITNRLTLASDIKLQHVDVRFANQMLTLPEGTDFDFSTALSFPTTNALLGMTGKFNVWGNMLATFTGLVPLNKSGLTDNFTPIVGLDYAW